MKLPVVLLLFLFAIHMLEAKAPGPPAGLGAAVQQAATERPVTVEGRINLLKELEESVRTALSNGQTLEAARNLNRKGELQLLLNDPQASLASHLQALEILTQSPDSQVEIDNLNGSAAAYLRIEKQEDLAQAALDKALSLSKQTQYPVGEAEALLNLCELQIRVKQPSALPTAQAALAIVQSLNDKERIARAHILLGRCYMGQNLLTTATENFTKTLEVARDLSNGAQEAEALIMLGYVEFRRGEWQGSIDYYSQAYGLIDETVDPATMGQIATGLGGAFLENGLPESGLSQYQRAVAYYQRAKEPSAVSYAIWGLARSYYLLGDLTQAENYIQQSLESVKKDSLPAAQPLEYLGRVHIDRGEYRSGLQHLEAALKIYTDNGSQKEIYRVRALLGQAYDRQGLTSRAKVDYLDALDGFTRLADRVNQAAVYYALGQLELKQKSYDEASSYLQRSIDVTENMRRVSTSSDLTTAFSATVQERYEAYIECLMKQHEKQPTRGFALRAFETSELARARTLSELLVHANVTPGVEPRLAARQRLLRQTLRLKENDKINLLAKTAAPEKLKALDEETARLEAEYKEVNEAIRSRFPQYDDISRPTAWNLRQIQEQILSDNDAVLLEYSMGAENSYAWTVTRDEFTSHKLRPQKVINQAVQRVYELLSTSPQAGAETELAQATSELSQLVLAPIASSLKKQRIILVADGTLNYVPFQLLRASSSTNEPLISTYEVINVPSASILGQLRQEKQQRQPRSRILAAFGDPVFASNYAQFKDSTSGELLASVKGESEPWRRSLRNVEINADTFDPSVIQPLTYSKFELRNLSDIAGPLSFVARGFDASRRTLETTDLSSYAILHFATHGLLDPKHPELSGFFLSTVDAAGRPQNGFITMKDVYRLQAPVDLVVLSACRTGLGKDVRGEGLIGLTRAFMYAGASSVVASLWKVDDEATSELMKHFYINMLKKGMRPAEALRAAQNTLRQDPQWQSPHFWAGFTLQGEFKQPIGIPTTRAASLMVQKAVGVGLLMALLAGIAWGYWRRRIN